MPFYSVLLLEAVGKLLSPWTILYPHKSVAMLAIRDAMLIHLASQPLMPVETPGSPVETTIGSGHALIRLSGL